MTLANWFTPRRRRAETSRRTSVVPPLAASEPVKVPEPRRSPEDATGALRAFRGQHVTESGTPHPKRGAFNFARILAERACPAYQPKGES